MPPWEDLVECKSAARFPLRQARKTIKPVDLDALVSFMKV